MKTPTTAVSLDALTPSAMSPMTEDVSQRTRSDRVKLSAETAPIKPVIIMQSAPAVDDRSDSWSDDSYESTDLDIEYDNLDEELDNEVILARIRRLGNQKGIWNNSTEFYAVALAYLISPDAIISAIYGIRKFGADIFWPMMAGAWFIAFPVMFMEFALGQFTSTSTIVLFKFMGPAFTAVSGLSIWMNMVYAMNDFALFVMTLSVLKDILESQSNQLTADSCFNPWNDIVCENSLNPCAEFEENTGSSYIALQGRCVQRRWYTEILERDIHSKVTLRQISPQFDYLIAYLTSVNEHGEPMNYFPGSHFLIYISIIFAVLLMVYILPHRSILHFAKVPLLLIFVFLATVLISSYYNPIEDRIGVPFDDKSIDWTSSNFRTWIIGHILIVSKIGQGGLISLGSQNAFRSNIFKHTVIMLLVAFLVPYLIAILIYPYMDKLLWNYVGDFNTFQEKKEEYFHSYDQGFNTIWSDVLLAFYSDDNSGEVLGTLFIFVIISIFVAHKILRLKTLVQPFTELYGLSSTTELSAVRRVVLFGLNLVYFNCFLTPHKTYAFYATSSGCAIVVLFEIICVFGFYGPRRLLCDLNLMMFGVMRSSKNIWKLRLREIYNLILAMFFGCFALFVCPYLLIHTIESTASYASLSERYAFSIGAPVSFFCYVAILTAYKVYQKFENGQLVWNLFKPIAELWGPRELHDRKRAEYQQRQMRVR